MLAVPLRETIVALLLLWHMGFANGTSRGGRANAKTRKPKNGCLLAWLSGSRSISVYTSSPVKRRGSVMKIAGKIGWFSGLWFSLTSH